MIRSTRIDVYFNKHWLTTKDPKDPSWIVRVNGMTMKVHEVVNEGASMRSVLAPDHKSTNAFLRFSGFVTFTTGDDGITTARMEP